MTITRRNLLAGGLSALALGGVARWALAARGARAGSRVAGSCAAPHPLPDDLVLYALGDFGQPGDVRARVMDALARHAALRAPAAILLLGDNFYPDGVSSIDDPRWRAEIEEPFAATNVDAPILAILGNHDHNGSTSAQVEYSRTSSRWRMPAARWTREFASRSSDAHEPLVELFALDTQPMRLSGSECDEQTRWLERELARSRARWKLVLGHHPALSYGEHGPCSTIGGALDALLARQVVTAYVAGHEHDQQLIESAAGWSQIVSGASSAPRPTTGRGDGSRFASVEPGFACLIARPQGFWVEFVGADSGVLACLSLARPGNASTSASAVATPRDAERSDPREPDGSRSDVHARRAAEPHMTAAPH